MQAIPKVKLMAIINATPDSFSGDGVVSLAGILSQAEAFLQAGADILDIGGESTRPNAAPVTESQELQRVIPAIEALRERFPDAVLSVDTYKAAVASAAVAEGANMINDVTGLQGDTRMAAVAVEASVPVVLMHNRARQSATSNDERLGASYDGDDYDDVVNDVIHDLKALAEHAESQGIKKQKIILDAGIGFGKTVQQNMRLIMATDRLKELGYPLLVGASRKSFIGKVLDREVGERLAGSVACAAMAAFKGCDIVRVHDVAFMADFFNMVQALREAD